MLGDRIRMLRLRTRTTQRDLVKLTGISQSAISRIESGKCQISIEQLEKIGSALGKAAWEILKEGDKNGPTT